MLYKPFSRNVSNQQTWSQTNDVVKLQTQSDKNDSSPSVASASYTVKNF